MPTKMVYGLHSVQRLLKTDAKNIREIYTLGGRNYRLQRMLEEARDLGVEIIQTDKDHIEKLVTGGNHQGIAALCNASKKQHDLSAILSEHGSEVLILVLDGIQDPHNLGACLRAADGAGVHAVILPKDKSCGLTPVVYKVASGAAETIPVLTVTNLGRALDELRDAGVWVVGTTDDADEELYVADLTGPTAIVMGSEQKGLRRLTREHCDRLIKIPMYGSVSSLNVSVATGVVLFEIRRQRLQIE